MALGKGWEALARRPLSAHRCPLSNESDDIRGEFATFRWKIKRCVSRNSLGRSARLREAAEQIFRLAVRDNGPIKSASPSSPVRRSPTHRFLPALPRNKTDWLDPRAATRARAPVSLGKRFLLARDSNRWTNLLETNLRRVRQSREIARGVGKRDRPRGAGGGMNERGFTSRLKA